MCDKGLSDSVLKFVFEGIPVDFKAGFSVDKIKPSPNSLYISQSRGVVAKVIASLIRFCHVSPVAEKPAVLCPLNVVVKLYGSPRLMHHFHALNQGFCMGLNLKFFNCKVSLVYSLMIEQMFVFTCQSEVNIFLTFFNSLKCKEQTNTNSKLPQAPSIIKCDVYHVWLLTHTNKPFFPHFRKFSKNVPDFKHSYLSQMTTKN